LHLLFLIVQHAVAMNRLKIFSLHCVPASKTFLTRFSVEIEGGALSPVPPMQVLEVVLSFPCY
jgi:hypothetical protein